MNKKKVLDILEGCIGFTLKNYEYDITEDYINKLQQENNELNKKVNNLNSQLDFISEQNKYIERLENKTKELQSKIDKAIQYIKKDEIGIRENLVYNANILLSILKRKKGGNK